ncbi:MAG: glycosyltransferase family 2 protein [Chloroflexi bacterium]|nr:glycosyltransferase family 2 protein [Chloroflexota bacterium]
MIDGKLSLVLPAHNEEENISIVVSGALAVLPEVFSDFEVIVVDDGSKDRTPQIADELARQDSHVRVIHHPHNRGYGSALTSGFHAATGDFMMFMDSDRQFDIRDIKLLAPYVGNYDIVAGYRRQRSDALRRTLLGRTFNLLVQLVFRVKVRDIDCGFKIFRADLLRHLELQSPGALINAEIHAKANMQGATIMEVGVNHYPRLSGEQSGGSLRVVSRAFWELARLWWRLQSYRPPAGRKGRGPVGVLPVVASAIFFVLFIPAVLLVRKQGGSNGGL